MRAIRLHRFGPAENLVLEEVAAPVPGQGEVLVDVAAAGVHLLDTHLRRGIGGGPAPLPELPATPGREVAGTVSAVGPGADPAWVGRSVAVHLGSAGEGGYAEQVVAAEASLHNVADGLDPALAVAMIGTGRTVMGVLRSARLGADDTVLVLAAAGGMGSLLVQAARNAGATVVGAAGGPAKVERVRGLKVDLAVDYDAPDWTELVRTGLDGGGVSLVLDGVGGAPGAAALDLLGVGGRVVLHGWSAGAPTEVTTALLAGRGLTATWGIGPAILRGLPGGIRDLETASLAEAAAGRLVPEVTRFPLTEAATAHTALVERGTVGKVVLEP